MIHETSSRSPAVYSIVIGIRFYYCLKKAKWEDCGMLCKCSGPVEKGDQHLNLSPSIWTPELQAELKCQNALGLSDGKARRFY